MSISYADEVVLLATNEEMLRDLIKKLQKYLEKRKLTVNLDKTKIMKFRETRDRKNFKMKCERKIQRVKSYSYLGDILRARQPYARSCWARSTRVKIICIIRHIQMQML